MKTCPRCKCIMDERFPGALSRRDNKTEICSECGTLEAMEDYVNSRKKIIKITKQNLEVKMQNKQ